MRCGDLSAVTGYTNKPYQTLFARFDAGLKCAIGTQRSVPLDRVRKAVKLNEIESLHTQALEGKMNLAFGFIVGPQMRLARNEKAARIFFQPRSDPQLGIPVTGREIKVVNTVAYQDIKRLIGVILRDLGQRCSAKYDPRTLVPGASEELLGNHELFHRYRTADLQARNSQRLQPDRANEFREVIG